MATLRFCILKNKRTSKGVFPVYLAVTLRQDVRYIDTGLSIPEPKNLINERIVDMDGADMMNYRLENIMKHARTLLDGKDTSGMTCTQLKVWLANEMHETLSGTKGRMGIADLFDWRIAKYRDGGNESYASIHEDVKRVIVGILGNYPLEELTRKVVRRLHDRMAEQGYTPGGISMKMAKFKAALKEAEMMGWVRYLVSPFVGYAMAKPESREMDITREEFKIITEHESSSKRVNFARDIFLLSFYSYGLNIADLLNVTYKNRQLSFVREKTRNMKTGNKTILLTVPKEAEPVLTRITEKGRVVWPCKAERKDILSYVNRGLRLLRQETGINSKLSSYTARKTFCQFAFENDTDVNTIKYCIGQSFEGDWSTCNVNRIMQQKGQQAMTRVLSFINN